MESFGAFAANSTTQLGRSRNPIQYDGAPEGGVRRFGNCGEIPPNQDKLWVAIHRPIQRRAQELSRDKAVWLPEMPASWVLPNPASLPSAAKARPKIDLTISQTYAILTIVIQLKTVNRNSSHQGEAQRVGDLVETQCLHG